MINCKRALIPAWWISLYISWVAFGSVDAIDLNLYLNDVKFLASKELRGRATGSPELEKAKTFIAGKFREFGLKPADGKSYFQPFPVTTAARLGKANHFQFTEKGKTTTLHFQDDFIPFNFSRDGRFSGSPVFVGSGITAPEYSYDDCAGMDVKGKVVVMLRHEPQESDPKSVFEGKTYTTHAQFAGKASNAKMHGAIAVILVSDRANHRADPDQLEKFGATAGPGDAGIPFVHVKESRIESWF